LINFHRLLIEILLENRLLEVIVLWLRIVCKVLRFCILNMLTLKMDS